MATVIGTRQIRPDGRDKVTGAGRYAADMTMTGMLHAKFRYADHPHARTEDCRADSLIRGQQRLLLLIVLLPYIGHGRWLIGIS